MNFIAYFGIFGVVLKLMEVAPVSWWYIAIPFIVVFSEPVVKYLHKKAFLFFAKWNYMLYIESN